MHIKNTENIICESPKFRDFRPVEVDLDKSQAVNDCLTLKIGNTLDTNTKSLLL